MNDPAHPPPAGAGLGRRIGLFDATTAVMGGIVGAGIFLNPSVVARIVPFPWVILLSWTLGGVIALVGAWIYAELGSERPAPGGQYAYFREAYHPCVAFLYGWGLLWVVQSGGMAAVAVTFAKYTGPLIHWRWDDRILAIGALGLLTIVNCSGVRSGAATQSLFTVLKSAAILVLIFSGFFFTAPASNKAGPSAVHPDFGLFEFGAAMVPVLFAYGGWQTACFLAGEIKEPERNLPRALVFGISAVITLYLATSAACLRTLGPDGLASTSTPASDVMRHAFGERGAQLIACGIVISTFGFLSQGMLTAPRVYYAMARDRLFFAALGRVHSATGSPILAVMLQGAVAALITYSGSYETILNYVVSVDFVFYGLAGLCVFRFRRMPGARANFRIPFHPWSTIGFIAACWLVVANLVFKNPGDSLRGLGILATGLPVFALWKWMTSAS